MESLGLFLVDFFSLDMPFYWKSITYIEIYRWWFNHRNFEVNSTFWAAQSTKLNVARKSKLFVDQTMREQEHGTGTIFFTLSFLIDPCVFSIRGSMELFMHLSVWIFVCPSIYQRSLNEVSLLISLYFVLLSRFLKFN